MAGFPFMISLVLILSKHTDYHPEECERSP